MIVTKLETVTTATTPEDILSGELRPGVEMEDEEKNTAYKNEFMFSF